MNLLLISERSGQDRIRKWLQEGQTLTVGSSFLADVCIDDDPSLAERHCTIGVQANECWIQANGDPPATVLVNNQRILRCRLEDRDIVIMGACAFRILIYGLEAAADEVARPSRLAVRHKDFDTRLCKLSVNGNVQAFLEVFKRISEVRTAIFAANVRRANITLADLDAFGDDVLAHAPEDLRKSDSLQVFSGVDPVQFESLWLAVWGRDAAMAIFANVDFRTFLQSHSLYWGWFSRPSILAVQLEHGSRRLFDLLFHGVDAVACESTRDELAIYVRPWAAEEILTILASISLTDSDSIATKLTARD